jgi:hypothetical protein
MIASYQQGSPRNQIGEIAELSHLIGDRCELCQLFPLLRSSPLALRPVSQVQLPRNVRRLPAPHARLDNAALSPPGAVVEPQTMFSARLPAHRLHSRWLCNKISTTSLCRTTTELSSTLSWN